MFWMYSAVRKNIASIANEMMKAITFAPKNVLDLKNSNCTIGAAEYFSSTRMNATRATAAMASRPTIFVDPQPQLLLSTRARMRAVRPTDRVAMPGMSTVRSMVSSRDSCVANSVTATAPTATGTLMKKIARQDTYWVSAPPTTGPSASASAETPAHVPIARPRSAGGNSLEMIERVPGIMNAAPTPWTARPATSQASLGARPIAALEAANTITPK